MTSLEKTLHLVAEVLNTTPLSLRADFPSELVNIGDFHQKRMAIVVFMFDVTEVVTNSKETVDKVKAVMDRIEPGAILRMSVSDVVTPLFIETLVAAIHKELYEIVPVYSMLHYPQDGKGRPKKRPSKRVNKA
jgi:hypothetical protein